LEAVLDWTLKSSVVDANRIAVLGSSFGAAVSIYVTAHHREIAGLIAFASPAILEPRKEPAQAVKQLRKLGIIRNPEFPSSLHLWNQEYSEINPSDHIGNITTQHILILQGETDEVVPPHNAQILFELAKEPKEITLLPGVSHRFRHEPLAITTALEWLKGNFLEKGGRTNERKKI
jgi:dipeptidyl aminopeptidase/acylaminoacyl peptidase